MTLEDNVCDFIKHTESGWTVISTWSNRTIYKFGDVKEILVYEHQGVIYTMDNIAIRNVAELVAYVYTSLNGIVKSYDPVIQAIKQISDIKDKLFESLESV